MLAAADNIDYCRKSLAEGERELIKATENLSKVLAEADPTVVDSDVFQLTSDIEADKDKLLEDWRGIRRANQDLFNSAQSLTGQSKSKEISRSMDRPKVNYTNWLRHLRSR